MASFAFIYWLTDGDLLKIMAISGTALLVMFVGIMVFVGSQFLWRKIKAFRK